ncbi:MAG: KH domain-containing protein, partial [Armatimonadetes bacterium]|nr:KH domain-containing protein [Armatimonadota bacterium]
LLGFLGQPSATVRVTRKKQPPAEPPAAPAVLVEPSKPAEAVQPTVEEWGLASGPSDEASTFEEEVQSEVETDQIEEGPDQEASELAEQARSLVQEIVVKMDLDTRATVLSEDSDSICIDLHGRDLAILIGKHGMHLNALQYLVNVMLNKNVRIHKKIYLDGGGYRERRERSLTNLALATAGEVKRKNIRIRLGQLRADERRIVHAALQDDGEIQTYSEGEEPNRKLIIAPAGQSRSEQGPVEDVDGESHTAEG